MAKKKADAKTDEGPAKKQKPDDEEKPEEEDLDFNFPTKPAHMAAAIRQGWKMQDISRRFFQRKERESSTAIVIASYLLNGHLHGKKGFKRQFKKEFAPWANQTQKNSKLTNAKVLINEYSIAFGSQMTAIKSKWFEHPTTDIDPEEGDSFFDKFVIMTRSTFENSAIDMICEDTSTFEKRSLEEATEMFHHSYQVRNKT